MSMSGEIATELSRPSVTAWIVAALLAGTVGAGLWLTWRATRELG